MSKYMAGALLLMLLVSTGGAVYALDSADNQADNKAYAIMQNCLAGAEASGNLDSQLDRYCIESYLATRSQ